MASRLGYVFERGIEGILSLTNKMLSGLYGLTKILVCITLCLVCGAFLVLLINGDDSWLKRREEKPIPVVVNLDLSDSQTIREKPKSTIPLLEDRSPYFKWVSKENKKGEDITVLKGSWLGTWIVKAPVTNAQYVLELKARRGSRVFTESNGKGEITGGDWEELKNGCGIVLNYLPTERDNIKTRVFTVESIGRKDNGKELLTGYDSVIKTTTTWTRISTQPTN